MIIYELGLVAGLLAVASHPSPYFAALGLVGSAGAGCLILKSEGGSFLCLVLFLVYLGGMMVVFAYSAALIVDPYPEAWWNVRVAGYLGSYTVLLGIWHLVGGNMGGFQMKHKSDVFGEDWFGVSVLYGEGGWVLLIVGWSLLLTLFSVLGVVRGRYAGVLRAV